MKEWMSSVRSAQVELAKQIAAKLFAQVEVLLRTEVAKAAEFIDGMTPETIREADPKALRELYASELGLQVFQAVNAYTDWAATLIVRSRRYEPRKHPIPSTAAITGIARKYGMKPAILRFVIDELLKQPEIPLLGRKEGKRIVPHKKMLQRWEKLFD